MSDRQTNLENHQQILRYLRKQMAAAELAEFEVRLMDDPELIRETQREEALIAALHDYQHALVSTPVHSGSLGFREWFFQPMTAAAAVVVLLVSIPLISLQQRIAGTASIESLQIASTHYVEGLRSTAQTLNLQADFPLLLNVDAGPGSSGDDLFSISMRRIDEGEFVYSANEQRVSDEGYLSLLLRESVAGEFEITVSNAAANDTIHYNVSIQ